MISLFGVLHCSCWQCLALACTAAKQIKGDSINYLVAGRTLALPLQAQH